MEKLILDNFRDRILDLKDKNQYDKEDLLNEKFLIKKEDIFLCLLYF